MTVEYAELAQSYIAQPKMVRLSFLMAAVTAAMLRRRAGSSVSWQCFSTGVSPSGNRRHRIPFPR